MKNISFLLLAISLIPTPLFADIIELKNGQTLEAVILEENADTISARMEVGTITIDKRNVEHVKEHAYEKNRAMLESWKRGKKKETVVKSQTPARVPEEEDADKEIRYIRYGDKWISEEKYAEIKQEKKKTWREKLEEEKERVREVVSDDFDEKLIEETKELTIQGAKRRSDEANRALAEGDWKHIKEDFFILFYKENHLRRSLPQKIETLFDEISSELQIKDEIKKVISPRMEVYAVTEKEDWDNILQGQYLQDTPNGFTKIFKREIFLYLEEGQDVDSLLAHELTHLILKEYANIKVGTNAAIPLWINEGYANYKGTIINKSAMDLLIKQAVKYQNHFTLAKLQSQSQYPLHLEAKTLFYGQATHLIHYLHERFGREAFLSFLEQYLLEYQRVAVSKKILDKKIARQIFERALDNSLLAKKVASYVSFEENWLKSILK